MRYLHGCLPRDAAAVGWLHESCRTTRAISYIWLPLCRSTSGSRRRARRQPATVPAPPLLWLWRLPRGRLLRAAAPAPAPALPAAPAPPLAAAPALHLVAAPAPALQRRTGITPRVPRLSQSVLPAAAPARRLRSSRRLAGTRQRRGRGARRQGCAGPTRSLRSRCWRRSLQRRWRPWRRRGCAERAGWGVVGRRLVPAEGSRQLRPHSSTPPPAHSVHPRASQLPHQPLQPLLRALLPTPCRSACWRRGGAATCTGRLLTSSSQLHYCPHHAAAPAGEGAVHPPGCAAA